MRTYGRESHEACVVDYLNCVSAVRTWHLLKTRRQRSVLTPVVLRPARLAASDQDQIDRCQDSSARPPVSAGRQSASSTAGAASARPAEGDRLMASVDVVGVRRSGGGGSTRGVYGLVVIGEAMAGSNTGTPLVLSLCARTEFALGLGNGVCTRGHAVMSRRPGEATQDDPARRPVAGPPRGRWSAAGRGVGHVDRKAAMPRGRGL